MMSLPRLTALGIAAVIALSGCAGPQSEVEVAQLKQLIDEGEVQKLNQLVAALDSTDPKVREAAVRALADLGSVAVPILKETVNKRNARSGPALLALGLMGEPDLLGFIRSFSGDSKLGAYSRQGQRVIEDSLYKEATEDGGLPAMEAYLLHFPEGSAAAEVQEMRLEALARISYARLKDAPEMDSMRQFLESYGETKYGDDVRQMLVRGLIASTRSALDNGEYEQARIYLKEVAVLDPRRSTDVSKFRAESHILEGEAKLASGDRDGALQAFEQASRFSEVREEASRRMARILFEDGRKMLDSNTYDGANEKLDRAGSLDPTLRADVSRLKSDSVRRLIVELEDPAADHLTALNRIFVFGAEAVRPMEEYLGALFVARELERVEEVMTSLGITLGPFRGQDSEANKAPLAATRLRDSLAGFIRSGYTTSLAEVSRLFSSGDFQTGWAPKLEPLDPRQSSLVLRVEQVTANYLGLLRIGMVFKAMLGDSGLEVISGSPIPEAQLQERVSQGEVGANTAMPLLNRIQLAGTYASSMGALVRTAKEDPKKVLSAAATLPLPILGPAQWMKLSEALGSAVETAPSASSGRSLVKVEADTRQVSLSVHDPIVSQLALGTEEVRSVVENHTMDVLMGLTPLVYGLYPGVDRVTVILGSLTGSRFEPQTRYVINRKGYQLAASMTNSGKSSAELFELLNTRWTRWATP